MTGNFNDIGLKEKIIDYSEMNEKDNFHIAFGIDDNFVEPMSICALSVAEKNPKLNIIIHVIIDAISKENLQRLKALAKKRKMNIIIHLVDNKVFDRLASDFFYTKATYNRLLLPYIVDKKIEKILYLDADILCFNDIYDLYNLSLNEKIVAVVKDQEPEGTSKKKHKDVSEVVSRKRLNRLGFSCSTYFNAGVLLINLPLWRKYKVSEQALINLQKYNIDFPLHDQDSLNSVLANKLILLEKKYNYMYSVRFADNPLPDLSKISLLHYASRYKLWQQWCDHPLQKDYLKYRNLTPWKNLQLMQPRNYKDNRSMGEMFYHRGNYLKMIYWMIKYGIAKLKYKL